MFVLGATMRNFLLAGLVALSLTGCITLNPFAGSSPSDQAGNAVTPGAAGAVVHDDPRIAALTRAGVAPLAGAEIATYMDQQETMLRGQLRDTGVSVTRVGNQIVLNIPTGIAFEAGKASLTRQFTPVLVSLGTVLTHFDRTLVDVYGYTDSEGPEAYNLDLSQRRAVSVATTLSNQGVDQERFYIQGKGEADPIASNATESGRSQNRRVVIQIAPMAKG
jgi:outer membrane protein OmpA-like peptidoglycan-associated protein